MKHPVGKLDIAKEIRGIWTEMKDDHDYNTTIFCKLIIWFLIGWSEMSNLYIFEAWLCSFWLVEARCQIYIYILSLIIKSTVVDCLTQIWNLYTFEA